MVVDTVRETLHDATLPEGESRHLHFRCFQRLAELWTGPKREVRTVPQPDRQRVRWKYNPYSNREQGWRSEPQENTTCREQSVRRLLLNLNDRGHWNRRCHDRHPLESLETWSIPLGKRHMRHFQSGSRERAILVSDKAIGHGNEEREKVLQSLKLAIYM